MICSNKKCHREKPDDGFKTCERCREHSRRWATPVRLCLQCNVNEVGYRQKLCVECRSLRKEERLRYCTNWLQNHTESSLLSSAKYRAKRDGLPFNLVVSDIIIPSHCPVLGILLCKGVGVGNHQPNSPSLDKIIPELGYVKGNVAVISHKANAMKNNETDPQMFRRLADWLEKVKHVQISSQDCFVDCAATSLS